MVTKNAKTLKNRMDLAEYFAKLELNKGVEVGVRWGKFSSILCEKNKNLTLKSVDPYDLVYQDVRSHVEGIEKQKKYFKKAQELLKSYNCEIIKKESLDAVKDFPYESLDFVYIDGSHQFDFVMCDIIEWGKRIRKGGIISGHDYYNFRWAGVVRAVDNYCQAHKIKKLYLTKERTPSWWFKKTW